jgi:hypothetical protein
MNLTDAYKNNNFDIIKSLTKEFDKPLDNEQNIILHWIARDNKLALLKMLYENNKGSINSIINTQNKKGRTPLHIAVENNKNANQLIITYMIDVIGAYPDIPDNDNRIVERKKFVNIDNVNNQVITNIHDLIGRLDKLSNENDKIINDKKSNDTTYNMTNNAELVSKLIASHKRTEALQQGGVKKVKKSKKINLTESGTNDSFGVSLPYSAYKRHYYESHTSDSLLDSARHKFDPKVNTLYKSLTEVIMKELKVDEETAYAYLSAIKRQLMMDNEELRPRENDELRVKEVEKIVKDSKKLKEYSKNIDIESVKKVIRANREKREQDRAAKKDKPKKSKKKDTTTSESQSSEKSSSSKKKKSSKQLRKMNYVQSEDAFFT